MCKPTINRSAAPNRSAARFTAKFAFIAAALLAAALPATAARAAGTTYTSPLHNFSVPVPPGTGMHVQEQRGDEGGVVSFHDDAGSLKSILYLHLSPETAALQHDRKQRWLILESFLNDYAVANLIRRASPAASVLHAEHINGNAYFALVDIPEGSTMFDDRDGRRFDTKRGLLVFIQGEFIYMLSSGEHPSAVDVGQPPKPLRQLIETEKTSLAHFRASIRFR